MKEITPDSIAQNPIQLIDHDWLVISAGTRSNMNLMTISWGSIGELWGKPIFTAYVSISRHTYKFLEENDYFTITHFPPSFRKALGYLGSASGRDEDKIAGSGLTPLFTDLGNPIYAEADLAIECRKIYSQPFDPARMPDSVYDEWYRNADRGIHHFYIGEILHVWEK